MPRLHGFRWTDEGPPASTAGDGALMPFEASIAPRALLPPARIGRSAIGAGGLLARLWDWIRLPRVELFRRCARCGLVRDEDRARARRMTMQTCTGWLGEPYNRCMSAQYRLG